MVSINNRLNEQFLQNVQRDPRFGRLTRTVIDPTICWSRFRGSWKAMSKFARDPGS